MAYCPSQDWDRYAAEQDDAAEAEICWWQTYREYVLQVTCAIMSNVHVPPEKAVPKEIVNLAADIVMEITKRSEARQ